MLRLLPIPLLDETDTVWHEAACALFVVWAARTGRGLRPVPVEQLSARELEEFWADDQLDSLIPRSGETPTMHKPLVAVDIVAFGDLRRDLDLQVKLRTSMYQRVAQAFTITGLSLSDCHHEDRGDGALIVAPADANPCQFLDPLAHHLAALLRRENRYLAPAHRLRLRVAAHYGHAVHDAHGIVGRAPVELFRHLEAPAFKKVMTDAPDADLGLIVSGSLFHEAVQRGGLIDRDAYRPVRVTLKETRAKAWIWLPPRPAHHAKEDRRTQPRA